MDNQLPTVTTKYLYHAGDLTQPVKLGRPDSQEGACLSVSHCPLEWCDIAKLPAKYIHTLKKDSDFTLFDMHQAYKDINLMQTILEWAHQEGLVEEKVRWRAWYFDSESDEWRHYTCDTKEAAEVEISEVLEFLEEGDECAPPGHMIVEPVVLWVSTPKLALRMRQVRHGDVDATDFAVMAWVEDTMKQIDGVWWNQTYDPYSLSAPRGGLFQRVLPECVIDTQIVSKWSAQKSYEDIDEESAYQLGTSPG